ncbi:Chaperone protein DnaJ-like protein [Drosera capensis]
MECNRDEAARSKAIAERKFIVKDFRGAKKFAMKAHALFPGLEGIEQMVATFEVHLSAENKVNGEADWYRVLGTASAADDGTVRKQYRKLALMLHPDKNKSVGAEGAFKLLSEAWSVLSDKTRKAAYDQKRNGRSFQMKATSPSNGPPPPSSNGFYNFAEANASTSGGNTGTSRTNTGTSRVNKNSSVPGTTFWTVCLKCKVQYEYLRKYLNHNLLCPNCHQPFIAKETPPPVRKGSGSSARQNSSSKTKISGVRLGSSSNSHARNIFEWVPFSGPAGASTVSQVASVVQQTYEKVKKEREDAQAKKRREKSLKRKSHVYDKTGFAVFDEHPDFAKKRRGIYDADLDSIIHMNSRSGEVGRRRHETTEINGVGIPDHLRELPYRVLRDILAEKAMKEIRNSVRQKKWSDLASSDLQKEKSSRNAHEEEKGSENTKLNSDSCNQGSRRSETLRDKATFVPISIDVPDPDFCDFDKDRTENSFSVNQVWAAYDDDDGMPRYYAFIHRILLRNPFKMQIRWLNSKTSSEPSMHNWVGSGFTKTCGDFETGGFETYDSLDAFSHKVRWVKGGKGDSRIFPCKGEVWALYRNWSPDWDELTASEVIHKYEMVEVLADYDDEVGVIVIPLVKVAGFKAVFHHHLDPKEARRIPREEMLRFSHQVPAKLLSGTEASNAPKGCWELDPAAISIELLQVLGPMMLEDLLENDVNDSERPAQEGDPEKATSQVVQESTEDVRLNAQMETGAKETADVTISDVNGMEGPAHEGNPEKTISKETWENTEDVWLNARIESVGKGAAEVIILDGGE